MKRVYALLLVFLVAAVVVTVSRNSFVASAQTDVRAIYTDQDLPINDPNAALWDQATEISVPLSGQNIATPFNLDPTVDTIRMRSLHNGAWVAFLLEWDDSTKDQGGGSLDFRDSVALQFPVHGGQPFVCMGVMGAEVNILHWRADFQRDIEEGVPTISDIFPRASANIYPGEGDVAFTAGLAAGNPLSSLTKPSAVEDLIATGFGTLETQDHADVTGWGEWDGNKWKAVIARPLVTGDSQDAQLVPGQQMPVALAAWDGDNRDVNGRKAVSAWITVALDEIPGGGSAPAPTATTGAPTPISTPTPFINTGDAEDDQLIQVGIVIGLIVLLTGSVPLTAAIISRRRSS